MRFQRTLVLGGVGLLWLALGPWVLLLGLAALASRRVRAWLRPGRRATAYAVGAVLLLTGLVLVVPDGWLPIPPGPGALVTGGYAGRPFTPRPLDGGGRSRPDPTTPVRGPVGESPTVDTAWFGLQQCASLAVDARRRLVGVCAGPGGRSLRVVDPDSLHVAATKELPAADGCAGSGVALDDHGRAVVATADRRLLVVDTADADGHADLTTVASHDLRRVVPASDCVTSVEPGPAGVLWFATAAGRVGVVAGPTGPARTVDLAEEVAEPLAVDRSGAFVVTTHALYRLTAGARRDGPPRVAWRAAYDRGSRRRSGQPSQGSGTTPVVLPGGLVAITDNADPQMHVEVYRAATGDLVCRQAVFGDDAGATQGVLVPVGSGVVVSNSHGYAGPLATVLGRTTDGGLARVDVVGGECSVRWTSAEVAPSVQPALSLATGLLYTWTKPHSRWGADAWYLTAIDVRSGRTAFRVRAGLGWLRDPSYGQVTLGAGGAAYVGTLGGLVRVRDRS
ncbi:hypothetical protein [Nocardioides panaciterrulae]|uniref:Uncharacterized protein n=1 Tax=Nocardioides panaciterrulae TaxID=661492 RepID=A0A7Y9E3E5_9ACTN|nr:hypothetical protein [Nocardioides panaciterrulae]NYD40220.1 hypothetical protein [Nocardioides panaciterrulae]